MVVNVNKFKAFSAPPAGFWLKTPDFGLASDKVCEPEIFCASGTLVAQGVLFPAGTAAFYFRFFQKKLK